MPFQFPDPGVQSRITHPDTGEVWVYPDRVEDTALKTALLNAVNTSTDYASLKSNLITALS